MHRIRAGVTGLGLVFLVTLIGSIALAPRSQEAVRDEPGEPLAALGVAPSPGDRASGPHSQPVPDLALPPAESDPRVERPVAGPPGASGQADEVII
ncbi:hypothetical protein [Thermaurantiacus sp.]